MTMIMMITTIIITIILPYVSQNEDMVHDKPTKSVRPIPVAAAFGMSHSEDNQTDAPQSGEDKVRCASMDANIRSGNCCGIAIAT
eukprot:2490735-Amphidinium_carterae.1